MSLTTQELARTRSELRANFELTGLTAAEVAADLGYTPERLDATLGTTGPSDPVDVWELRDYLEQTVRDAGRTPVPFSTLTRGNKLRARMWFPLRRAPRHVFAAA
ncbi:DUF2316 family protein [Cellulomonas sp. PhB143]|uniref:DUF2316 family protein n=1 Tax=Cellulomonas sp. PhB143 TaxID=2485186 RepID=UPI000F48E239|nr:DUF2316 family protein [Cellulomonas sp. PhB143]ROS75390.1 hypothetical protein EDF32_1799 [Cellulomonas sp. PhB143]